MSGLRLAVEDRKADAVAHLAVARSQNTGPAFWGTTKDKGGRLVRPLFPSAVIFIMTGKRCGFGRTGVSCPVRSNIFRY